MNTATLERLRVKYEALVELRRERDECEIQGVLRLEGEAGEERRRRMRRVAREFPGALRELEYRSVTGLRARLHELERRIAGEDTAELNHPVSWIEVSAAFHSVLRCVLGVKAEVRREKGLSPERWGTVRNTLCAGTDSLNETDLNWLQHVDVWVINRYLDPPDRRLVNVVWEELSQRFGLSVGELKSIVFEGD